MNSLLTLETGLFDDAVDFNKIQTSEYLEALSSAVELAEIRIDKISQEATPNFKNIIEALECSSKEIDKVTCVFYAMYSAHCTDDLSKISEEFSEKLTNYSSNIYLNEKLFSQIEKVVNLNEQLTPEQQTLRKKTFDDFRRNGALLSDKDKEILRELDKKLSKLHLDFSENVRKATNDYILFVEDKSRLEGLSIRDISSAKELAKEKGREDAWAFSLQYPSYSPVLKFCHDRDLREELSRASGQRATTGEYDNSQIIVEILKLRKQRAALLGYKNHVDYTLENRMAKSEETVMTFLEDLYSKAFTKAQEETTELQKLQEEKLRSWDVSYLTEKLKMQKLSFDEETLKPYFQIENVIDGAFAVAKKLYGLNFKLRTDIPVYHKDVQVFEVSEGDKYIGLFYSDFFPRAEKRPGAWMTGLREQGLEEGEVKRPHVMIVCNFTPSTKDNPSLLNLDSVQTLFHEFGHALHGLLANTTYRSLSGPNVFWDFVELPSQVMENWVTEKECLSLFAKHYQTGEVIPDDLINKVIESQKFMEATATIRQLSFATLDMKSHLTDPESISNIFDFEEEVMDRFRLVPKTERSNMSCAFGHLYAGGGYASGYYSYKWAEVLDADAFSLFLEKGIFDQETAMSFRKNILEKGGTEDPMKLYRDFRGREPKVDALLERAGLS